MNPEDAAKLRRPFPPEAVRKLPRIWCPSCRNAKPSRVCNQHSKARCQGCNNNITTAHLHLDYVGHAETTDRLLQTDPEWTWEPLALDDNGLPVFDDNGGLWMRLTVAGVTRLGYGSADGKVGSDAVKEVIGDGLRNAAMRFGVALDLWGASGATDDDDPAGPAEQAERHPPQQAAELRARIARDATALGYDIDDVPQMFKAVMRTDIQTAGPATLIEFIHVHMSQWKAVVSGGAE